VLQKKYKMAMIDDFSSAFNFSTIEFPNCGVFWCDQKQDQSEGGDEE
jgi:hypothetical protein